jgi:hypothetical protein
MQPKTRGGLPSVEKVWLTLKVRPQTSSQLAQRGAVELV